jgi:ligand-binding sensor domain-containing protein
VDQLLVDQEFSAVLALDGSIWAGGSAGLFRIDPQSLQTKEIQVDGRSFVSVRSLAGIPGEDGEAGELWVGSADGLVALEDGLVQRRIGRGEGLLDPRVQDILLIDDTVWAATYSGIARISADSFRWLGRVDGLPGESIKALRLDRHGQVWAGSYDARGGGVAVLSQAGDVLQQLTLADGLVHNSITSIAETPDGRMLVGGGVYTEGGASVLEWDGRRWQVTRTIRLADGLVGAKVRQIYIDPDGRTWFCSEYDGVAIFAQDTLVRILTTAEGLSDNEVKQVIQDPAGDYWLATRRGLTRIRADALLP